MLIIGMGGRILGLCVSRQSFNGEYIMKIMSLIGFVLLMISCNTEKSMEREESNVKDSVWQTVQQMNQLWTVENNAEELVNYFHKNMIAITPTDSFRIEGRDACVEGWRKFADTANIIKWKEEDPKIVLYGNNEFAVVTYYFSMVFEINNDTIEMKGRDMFSLIKENEKWWIVSDQFSSFPAEL